MARDKYGRTIPTAGQLATVRERRGYRRWVEWLVRLRVPGKAVDWSTSGLVWAEVGTGVWRVKCVFCPGAQLAEPGEPFYCVDCQMVDNGGQAMEVVWPEQAEREAIESVLLARKAQDDMNYKPGEGDTLETLVLWNDERPERLMPGAWTDEN